MLDPSPMDGNDPDAIRLTAGSDSIGTAVSAAHGFAARHRLSDDVEARLAIVVEELVTNLVEHGGAPGEPIDLQLVRLPDAVTIIVEDRGTPFDPRDAVASQLPPERGGGAGILLVLAWTRVESYRAGATGNRLHLLLPTATT